MYNDYRVIDADAHIAEPYDLWTDFMEPEYYDRRPMVGPRDQWRWNAGKGQWFLPGELFPQGTRPRGTIQGGGPNRAVVRKTDDFLPSKFGDAYSLGFTAESRVTDMDRYGWDKQVLIDNFPLPMRTITEGADQGLLWACTRAYNNWARSFADTAPSRLKNVGVMPDQHDIEGLVTEARRVVEKLGAVTIVVPRPAKGKAWHDPEYDSFWALAEELDFPMSFHGVRSGEPHVGTRYQPRHMVSGPEVALEHAMGFAFENMLSMGHMIFLGVMERFPKMRCGFLEGNAGWLPFWLGRLDDHSIRDKRQGMWFDSDALKLTPSEYFKRQGFVACDGDEFGLKGTVTLVGEDYVVWNTDYPHDDAPDPDKAVTDLLGQDIPESAKRKILWDNSVGLYGQRILS